MTAQSYSMVWAALYQDNGPGDRGRNRLRYCTCFVIVWLFLGVESLMLTDRHGAVELPALAVHQAINYMLARSKLMLCCAKGLGHIDGRENVARMHNYP
eukprot:4223099-Amphidinium_carterae.1